MEWDFVIGVTGLALGWALRSWFSRGLAALVLDGHEHLYRLWWRWRSRRRGGRPRLDPELIALIRRISRENPLWGAPRIHGELLMLGFKISQSSVSKYMLRRHDRPGQTWMTFLRNHAGAIAAIDLLTVKTINFRRLYAFVVLAHQRRRILHIEVADRPTALWLARQMNLVLTDGRPCILIRDNDPLYGAAFRDQLRKLGIDDRPIQPRSPWQNGHVERLIGSIRRECLDHHLILNAAHLRRVLQTHANYYNCDRTHLALGKGTPFARASQTNGSIVAHPVLGGLHHRYVRVPQV